MKNAILMTLEEGGLTLWALLVLAVMIYSMIFAVWWHGLGLRRRVRGGVWREWGTRAEDACATFELDEMAWVERRLPFLGVLIAAAPLLGLMGTVAGMLMTFSGMAGAGGLEPIDVISRGISKALVTTQAGLVVAIPAAFLLALLRRQAEVTHVELTRQVHEDLAKGGAA